MSTSSPLALPVSLPQSQPLSPTPGSKEYRNMQLQIMKRTLSNLPEPTRGGGAYLWSKEAMLKQSQMIAFGEAQISKLGPCIKLGVLQSTLVCQFYRTLTFWRLFRFMDLPPEIISNIFRLVVWSTTHAKDAIRQRLHLTWVCRLWRRIMIDDPTLWNAVWFHDAPPHERSWEWFKRAGSAPLDVRINEYHSGPGGSASTHPKFTAQQMSDMLDRLFVKLSQIRMLVIIIDHWPPALTVLQRLQSAGNAGIPINIERLEIHRSSLPYVWIGPGFDTQGQRDPPVLFGGHTDRLNYLCLSGIHIDFNDTPLCNLTTLDLRHVAMNASPTLLRFREILRTCTKLDKLTLDGCGPQQEEVWVDRPPVEVPNLKIFTLGSFSLLHACYVLSQIRAPRVRDLNLMNMQGEDYTPLVAMLTHKFAQVRLLTLYSFDLDISLAGKQTFVRWLDTMPKIAYVRLARIKPEILKLFSENPMNYKSSEETEPARRNLCPKFDCLEVQGLKVDTIVQFCRMRKGAGVPMKKVYLNMPWGTRLKLDEIKLLQREAPVYYAPPGSNTMEEDTLLNEGWHA